MSRYLTPITIRNYPSRYNVLYQKPSIEEQVGAIKIAKRGVRNFGLNKHVPRSPNTLAEISPFLTKHKDTKPQEISVYDSDKKNLFSLTSSAKILHIPKTNDYYHLYKSKSKDRYYLWIPNTKDSGYKMMAIKAKDDHQFKDKLSLILSNDSAQAKLEYQVLPQFLNLVPFCPKHQILFKEDKITGDFTQSGFSRIGNDGVLDAFDTEIGTIDQQQLGYYLPSENFQNYSKREDKTLKVKDATWLKAHTLSIFVDASSEVEEILGNIVLQTYAGKKPDASHIAQMGKKIKDDYLYDLYGYKSRGGKIRNSGIAFVNKIPLGKFGTRWQFGNDALRGNRFWEDQGLSHEQLMYQLYTPQADGTTKFSYDIDPQKFMKIADKLAIKPDDKQYMMNYGRKAIGSRIALRVIQDELGKINLNDKHLNTEEKEKQKLKQLDLLRFQDKVFNGLGDLKDVIRKGSVGFSAYARAVAKEDIPALKPDAHYGKVTTGVPSEKGFVDSAVKGLGKYVENYAFFEEFWGWQGREYLGRSLFLTLKNKIFDKEIPDIVIDNAVTMLAETVDRSSRRMKSFSEYYLKDADMSSNAKTFIDRVKRLDFSGASEIITQNKANIGEFFKGRQSIGRTNVKRMIMQNEGIFYNREVWPTLSLKYEGNKGGRFTANYLGHIVSWKNGDKVAGDLIPLFTDIARIMKEHQKGIQRDGFSDSGKKYLNNDFVYKRPEMIALNEYLSKSSTELAQEYFKRNKDIFRMSPEADTKVLFKQVKTEYRNILNMICNIVGMISYMDEDLALGYRK